MVFGQEYHLIRAADPEAAMSILKLGIPDLIIGYMPEDETSACELCKGIKLNKEWDSLPVCIITDDDVRHMADCYKAGADMVMSIPFNDDCLVAAVESILYNRRILMREIVRRHEDGDSDGMWSSLTPRERYLLEKIHTIMDKNLSNGAFGVEDMANALDISYSSLYAKMKAMTGVSPLTYINNYRMDRAKEFLESKMFTVSEVAFKIGSMSPNTFSRDFKRHFGITPSSLIK